MTDSLTSSKENESSADKDASKSAEDKDGEGSPIGSDEASQVKFMIQKMAKTVEVGSEWFIVSMKWINCWQKFVNFDGQTKDEDRTPPGKINNSDILLEYSTKIRVVSGDNKSVYLDEMAEKFKFQNYQLKPHMKEGEHYMLVDKNIHSYWMVKYGTVNQI